MKTFSPQLLVTFAALLSVASAASEAGSEAAVALTPPEPRDLTQSRRKLDDQEPWDTGTKVYNEFPNQGWWSGTITAYDPVAEMYTVTWEDGSTDYYDDGDKIDEMVAYAQNDPQNNPAGGSTDQSGSYPTGTAVSMFEDGEWYDGVIIKYGSGTYTVEWDEDGEIEEIAAGSIMDQMVQDALGDDDEAPEGFDGGPSDSGSSSGDIAVGTPVSVFEDGEWWDGTVSDYSDNTYTIEWKDGSTNEYDDFGDDLEELKQAVEDYMADDDDEVPESVGSGPKFPLGTPVSDYEDGEWVEGEVVDFDDGSYVVEWEDEDELEYYESSNAEDMQALGNMASYSNKDDDAPPDSYFEEEDLWKVGTPVAITEDDNLWYGEISGFNNGEYSIDWENGEREWLDNFDLVNEMVSNAALAPKKGMSAVGKTFLSLFLIGVCAAGAVFGYRFYEENQKQRQTREGDLSLEDGGARSFRDNADELPKII